MGKFAEEVAGPLMVRSRTTTRTCATTPCTRCPVWTSRGIKGLLVALKDGDDNLRNATGMRNNVRGEKAKPLVPLLVEILKKSKNDQVLDDLWRAGATWALWPRKPSPALTEAVNDSNQNVRNMCNRP